MAQSGETDRQERDNIQRDNHFDGRLDRCPTGHASTVEPRQQNPWLVRTRQAGGRRMRRSGHQPPLLTPTHAICRMQYRVNRRMERSDRASTRTGSTKASTSLRQRRLRTTAMVINVQHTSTRLRLMNDELLNSNRLGLDWRTKIDRSICAISTGKGLPGCHVSTSPHPFSSRLHSVAAH